MRQRHRKINAGHPKRSVDIMARLDAIKEKLETARDEARGVWIDKAKGIKAPSAMTVEMMLEVDDARRAFLLAQVALSGATLMWIGAQEVYESHEEAPRTRPGSSAG